MGRHKADVVNLLPNGNTLMEELMIPYIMYILLAIEPATYSSLPLIRACHLTTAWGPGE